MVSVEQVTVRLEGFKDVRQNHNGDKIKMNQKVMEKVLAEREVSKIIEVRNCKEHFEVKKENGWCFYLNKQYGIIPKKGDKIVTYGRFGHPIQGIDINGVEAFFKTQAELNAEHETFCKKFHEDNWKDYQRTLERIKNEEPFETVDISGMSGGYEVTCQKMLRAGIKFLKEHPEFHFDYQTYPNIYGIATSDTPWCKDLDKILDEASGHDCTGAMHQAVISHLAYIHKHGYEKWLQEFPKERRYTYPKGLPKPHE